MKTPVSSIVATVRAIGFAVVLIGVIAGNSAWADITMYRDSKGGLHFSNAPTGISTQFYRDAPVPSPTTKVVKPKPNRAVRPRTGEGLPVSQDEARRSLAVAGLPFEPESFFKVIERDDFTAFMLYLAAGFAIETKRPANGTTPLYVAVDWGSYRIYRYLMGRGANVNVENAENGFTPLLRAISQRQYDIVWELLRVGASAAAPSRKNLLRNNTALCYAASDEDPKLIEALLKNGASPSETCGVVDEQILSWSVHAPENTRVLLAAGAPPNAEDANGNTPLLLAVCTDSINFEAARSLVNAGANVRHRSKLGYSVLFCAAFSGDPYPVQLLLDKGADVNEVTRLDPMRVPFGEDEKASLAEALVIGATPLMLASGMGNQEVVRVLLRNGANPAVIAEGKAKSHTARSLAVDGKHDGIVRLLDDWPAKRN